MVLMATVGDPRTTSSSEASALFKCTDWKINQGLCKGGCPMLTGAKFNHISINNATKVTLTYEGVFLT